MTHRMRRRRFLQHAAAASLLLPFGAEQVLAEPGLATRLPYTATEIAGRLGISMAVFQTERLAARHVAAIRELGIQRIELVMKPETFDFQDRRQVQTTHESRPSPQVDKPAALHVILQVEDDGTPSLVAYRRAIIKVEPRLPQQR